MAPHTAEVKKVYYVGFADHKDYEVTRKQTTGFGGMISFTVDSFETVKKILKGVDMIMFAGESRRNGDSHHISDDTDT